MELYGIDVAKGLSVVNGSKVLYNKLLKIFMQNTMFKDLQNAVAEGNVAAQVSSAHTLKGVAGNLSFTKLFELIKELEAVAKSGTAVSENDPRYLSFLECYELTMESVKKIVESPDILNDF